MPPTEQPDADGRALDRGVARADHIKAHRVHALPNTYTSPEAACEAWMQGSLWGNPIYLEGQVQVYGCWLRNWSRVYVQFTRKRIIVVQPPPPPRPRRGNGRVLRRACYPPQ